MKTWVGWIFALFACATITVFTRFARADSSITDATCDNIAFGDIPVASYQDDLVMPEDDLAINQGYNTSYEEGYWYGSTWSYGHTGLDTEGASDTPGVNDVKAILPGVVILSKRAALTGGWGESIIIATRMNQYSEEILTHHYHHMHATGKGASYITTRKFNACDQVTSGDVIGKEGSTGNSNGSHLHLGIRRWENIEQLKKAIANGKTDLFGFGYTYGDDNKLARNLDPEGFLFNTYLDYQWGAQNLSAYLWSLPYAMGMRGLGIDFGLYDGRFGAGEGVTRREAARWIKIAAMLDSVTPVTPTFTDVPRTDSDYPYVEKLVRFPETHPVLDPGHTCVPGAHYFCPANGITRAEALKMIVMAFYGEEFIQVYDNNIWKQSYNTAVLMLSIFHDVPAIAWYAPYIYFGVQKGIVSVQDLFHPNDIIKKEELAKWIIMGVNNINGLQHSVCWHVVCPAGHYCTTNGQGCVPIPTCVPSEATTCDVGGGFTSQSSDAGASPIPDAGMAQDAGASPIPDAGMAQDAGVSPIPDAGMAQDAGASPIPDASMPPPDAGPVPTQCQPGQTVCGNHCCNSGQYCENGYCVTPQTCQCTSGICCDGCNYRPSSNVCDQWYVYDCEGPNPGQNGRKGTVRRYCSGQSPSCDGQVSQPGWQTYQDCSVAQVCQMQNGMPVCVGICTDTYNADASQACFNNPQGAGSPTLCLEVQKNSGASFKYRICKQGGSFQNNFTYRLKDDNNMVNFTQYNGQAGLNCTPWQNFSVSYVTQYGSINGAGLRAQVISPAGCTNSTCDYSTGTITVSKVCQ